MKLSRLWSIILVISLLATLFSVPVQSQDGAESPQERALQFVANTYQIPVSELSVIDMYPTLDKAINENAEIIVIQEKDKPEGTVWKLAVDPSGTVMDVVEYKRLLAKKYREKYGKLSPELHELSQSMASDDTIKVNIWLKSDAESAADAVADRYPEAKLDGRKPIEDTDMTLYQKIQDEMNEAMKLAHASGQQPIIQDIRARGLEVFDRAEYAPVVFAELTKDAILELQERPDVDTIYRWRDDYKLELDVAVPTIGAPNLWDSGYSGQGIKVAIVEPGGIKPDHAYLPAIPDTSYKDPINKNIEDHTTNIAGIIASQHQDYPGVAPDVTLLSGNTGAMGDENITAGVEWAIDEGANIISMSLGINTEGSVEFLDRYLDYIAQTYMKTVIKSAGNINAASNPLGWVTSPGLGYNVITVGNFNDANSLSWDDESMAVGENGSCYRDPGTRDKPEVAAPGVSIKTTGAIPPFDPDGFKNATGTSVAAPMVAGEAALLMEQNLFLKTRSEFTKAVIMASSLNNIEGDSRLSDKDGVGGISAKYASNILSNHDYYKGLFYKASVPEGSFSDPYYIEANAGDTIRAVLCWNSHPVFNWDLPPVHDDQYQYSDLSDLDLYLYDPYGNTKQISPRIDRSWEIIEFDATVTGQYYVKIYNASMPRSYEEIGLAWISETLRTLTVSSSIGGSVTNPGEGTLPPYSDGEVVYLVAEPDTGYYFTGWTGDTGNIDNPNAASTNITMEGDYTIQANFAPNEYTLTVYTIGDGSVEKNPDQATYHYGDWVILTAIADTGWDFSEWSGGLSGTNNPDIITINGNSIVFAHFVPEVFESHISGTIYDVLGNETISGATVELYLNTILHDSTTSNQDGQYELTANETGNYTVVVSAVDFKDEAQDISIVYEEYTLNFIGNSGLIPVAPSSSYVLACANRWLYPPAEPELVLSMSKVLAVANAWLYPGGGEKSAGEEKTEGRDSITVTRTLPQGVLYPNDTFDVTVSFTASDNNFNAIGLTDIFPAGWDVSSDTAWCTPVASLSNISETNAVEYAWMSSYDSGTEFTALYQVTIPEDALAGTYYFPDGQVEYYIDNSGPYYADITGDSEVVVTKQLEFGSVTVGSTPVTVNLDNTYTSPVVVCSIQYNNNTTPVVTRVSNVTTTSFDVRLQNPSDGTIAAENVSYIVVEEGTWTIDGVKVEAQKYLSTVTDNDMSWFGELQNYGQTYNNPVVLGQVMSENDPDWSVFWCRGYSRSYPPSSTSLWTGKTVCEDTDTYRENEWIGFIVFESGHGTIYGVEYEAALGPNTVAGATNNPPYIYTFNNNFASAPEVAVTTMAGVNGMNGGWSYVHGPTLATTTSLYLSIDEDQIADPERSHINERVGYIVFSG